MVGEQVCVDAITGVPLQYWLISPFFIFALISWIIFIPTGIFGITNIIFRLRSWLRVRDGWIKVRKKLSNYHWFIFWARPTGRKIKIKGEEGIEFEIPIQIEENMLAMEQETDILPKGEEKEKKTEPPSITPPIVPIQEVKEEKVKIELTQDQYNILKQTGLI